MQKLLRKSASSVLAALLIVTGPGAQHFLAAAAGPRKIPGVSQPSRVAPVAPVPGLAASAIGAALPARLPDASGSAALPLSAAAANPLAMVSQAAGTMARPGLQPSAALNAIFDGRSQKTTVAGSSEPTDLGYTGKEASGSAELEHKVQLRALRLWGQSPRRTMVVVQSMSLDPELLKGVKGIEKYEARTLALILKARDPNLRIIFVTSRPVPQYAIDHLLRGRSDAEEIRSRVTFIALGDTSSESLSEPLARKLLMPAYSGVIERIRKAVAEAGRPAALIPFTSTETELEVARRLQIPLYSSHPSLAYWGTKSGSRTVFKNLNLGPAPGYEDIFSVQELAERISDLWTANRTLKRVMIKINDGVSGLGNLSFRLPQWQEDDLSRLSAIVSELGLRAKNKNVRDFLAQLQSKGGIVEEFVEEAKGAPSPSGQGKILSDGSVRVLSTHEQRLDNEGVYLGATYPAEALYRDLVASMTLEIGKFLAHKGARGRFAVDYMAIPDGKGGTRIMPVEINLRSGGTTHPQVVAGHATNAALDHGILTRPDGKPVVYNASDHTIFPVFVGMDVEARFLPFFQGKEVLFEERADGTGVRFHLLDAISFNGNIGYTVVARTRAEANRIEQKLLRLITELETAYIAEKLSAAGHTGFKVASVKKSFSADAPTVAILGPLTVDNLAQVHAARQHAPGDVHLVLNPYWLIREEQPDRSEKIFIKKALVFDAQGQPRLVDYKTPRLVRYLDAQGVEAKKLRNATSGLTAAKTTNDRLLTRAATVAKGIAAPATLGFLMPRHALLSAAPLSRPNEGLVMTPLADAQERGAQIRAELGAWLSRHTSVGDKVAVGVSGPDSAGVSFKPFDRGQLEAVAGYVSELAKTASDNTAIVIEKRISGPEFEVVGAMLPSGEIAVSDLSPHLGEALAGEARKLPGRVLKALRSFEDELSGVPETPRRGRSEFVSLRVANQVIGGKMTPVVLEIRGSEAADERFAEERAATMVQRARLSALEGKSIVVVGFAVGAHHRAYLEHAKSLGIKVQLIHLRESAEAEDVFAKYNPTDLVERVVSVEIPKVAGETAQATRERIANLAIAAAEKAGISREGVVSFVEEDVYIAAQLAQRWKLPHMTPASVGRLRDKGGLRDLSRKAGLPTPPSQRVASLPELDAALERIGLPAVLKPGSGSHALGVVKVRTAAEAREKFAKLSAKLAEEAKVGGDMSFDADAGIVLEKFLKPIDRPQGGEVDIDFVLRDGQVLYAAVTDNHNTLENSFAPTGLNMPSRHSFLQQDVLVKLAVDTAKAAGATRGVFHFEAMLTDDGAFMIEANPRMGGRPVWPINQAVWGVDLLTEAFLLAADIPGRPYVEMDHALTGSARMKPRVHIFSKVIFPPHSGVFRGVEGWENLRDDPRIWQPATMFLNPPGSRLTVSDLHMDRAYVVSTQAPTAEEAEAAHRQISQTALRVVMDDPASKPLD